MTMVNQNLKENIKMENEMEKEKNFEVVIQNLKENILMEKKMDMEKNLIKMENQNLRENI